jgi:ribosomal RNA assembly protein
VKTLRIQSLLGKPRTSYEPWLVVSVRRISLREVVGSSPNQLKRVAGRIIGESGRTRRAIEQITEAKISIYGRTVAIIGYDPGLQYAQKAIDMLIGGAPHGAVYGMLERARRNMTRVEAELWEDTDL